MKKKIIKSSVNYTAVPNDLLNDSNLSFEAKGLAAHAIMLDNAEGTHDMATIKFWDSVDKNNLYSSYYELVERGYINDVIGRTKQ